MTARPLSLLFVLLPLSVCAQDMVPGPKSPAESLKCMLARPGFKVELMAAEPLVQSPIAFAWGPDGKFWVVEMGDYPLGADGKGKPGGRVKLLTKSKEDGPYDKATVFLDNLGFPTGVTPWNNGVLITCAPDIFYAADTDGDGKADQFVQKMFTGFGEGNQQHRVNGLVYGLDNWLYGANGDSGGSVKGYKAASAVDIRGRDFRIDPVNMLIQAQSGQTQFGRARDDWGNWFGNNNSNPMWHYVLDDVYLKRNPHVFYPDVRVQTSVQPGASPVYPLSKPLPRFNNPHSLNHFTSACSAIIYRDNLFGPAFAGNSFVSEPVHNLIHREIVKPKGVTFTSQRADDEQKSEFLASTDNWFRPTMIQTGPDGALWVADMYRFVIEHPEWIPKDWQKKLDLRAGHDKGRIYRIYPEDKKPRAIPQLVKMKEKDLVAALASPNGWTRDMAQQVLINKKEITGELLSDIVLLDLRGYLKNGPNPLGRLHALCTLDGLYNLKEPDLLVALKDKDPGVRRHAIRCAELSLRSLKLTDALKSLVDDTDPQVRLQLANSLGFVTAFPDILEKLGGYLGDMLGTENDRFIQAALYSSLHKYNWPHVLEKVLARPSCSPAVITQLLQLAPTLGESFDQVRLLAFQISDKSPLFNQFFHMGNILDALGQSKSSLRMLFEKKDDVEYRKRLEPLKEVFVAARKTVQDPKAPVGEQLLAVKLLGRGFDQFAEDHKLLASLLVPQTPEDIQGAAIMQLGLSGNGRVPSLVLKQWKGFSPSLRAQVLDVLLTREMWTRHLIFAMEHKEVLPSEVDIVRRQRFLEHNDEGIRKVAGKLFVRSSQPQRNKVVEEYLLPLLSMKGVPQLGSKVFVKHCATCHQLAGLGQAVGPDLAAVADKSPEGLITAILDPNRGVESRYLNFVAVTKGGEILSGLLQSETSTSVTLITADGKKHGILRKDLDDLASTGRSVMPEGFEKDIPPREMVDLISFLRDSIPKPKRKVLEGNQPETVRPQPDGTLRLLPRNAALFGKTLILEKQHANLGYWNSADDRAVWAVAVPKDGTYAVWLNWACAGASAGNNYQIVLGTASIQKKVDATKNWDTYHLTQIGQVSLAAGQFEVQMQALGPIRGSLLDLKEIQLVPVPVPTP